MGKRDVVKPDAVIDIANRMTRNERAELRRQEKRIERALPTFTEIGEALNAIRSDRLYRETHGSFDDYLADRWSFTRQRAAQLIDAAETMRQLPAAVKPAVTTERAARAIKPVADKPAAAKRAAKLAGPNPSAADLERSVATVVGDRPDATPPASDGSPTPPGPDQWVTLTNQLHLPGMTEPALRKLRGTAVGLVAAIDVALDESRRTRHATSARKRAPAKPNRPRDVVTHFKGGK